MTKFRFNYSVDGVKTLLPLWVVVEAFNYDEALIAAHEKIKSTDSFVRMGLTYQIHT